MKNLVSNMVLWTLISLFYSCATQTTLKPGDIVIGSVQVENIAAGFNNIENGMKKTAYPYLLAEAKKRYSGNIDVVNILITTTDNPFNPRIFSASGSVILIGGNAGNSPKEAAGVEGALARAAEQVMSSIRPNSKIAIVYVTSNDPNTTEFIANELEYIMVNEGFIIIDRSQLDRIRREQNFQLSGDVDDETAVSIGKIVGADIIITGSVTGADSTRRLRLRALNTQTAQVMAVASERL